MNWRKRKRVLETDEFQRNGQGRMEVCVRETKETRKMKTFGLNF